MTVTHAGEVFAQKLIGYIKNGIPLPKEHGRLIDASELLTVTDVREDGSEITYVLYDDIENADTIVEAKREDNNG